MASAVVHRVQVRRGHQVQVRPGHQVHPAPHVHRVPPVPDRQVLQAHPAPRVHQVHRVPPVPDRQVLQVRAHPAPHVHRIHLVPPVPDWPRPLRRPISRTLPLVSFVLSLSKHWRIVDRCANEDNPSPSYRERTIEATPFATLRSGSLLRHYAPNLAS
jgi:hypothetical protein